jgi:hypothetical protein
MTGNQGRDQADTAARGAISSIRQPQVLSVICDLLLQRMSPVLARCRCHGRRPWRPVTEVLRARHLPLIATIIASIRRRHSGSVPWRPVLKQVLPWRSLNSAAGIDPLRKPTVQRSSRDHVDLYRDQCGDGYSIAASARTTSPVGNSIPRAFAVLRLRVSSIFVACSTGRSAGFSPFRMRPV